MPRNLKTFVSSNDFLKIVALTTGLVVLAVYASIAIWILTPTVSSTNCYGHSVEMSETYDEEQANYDVEITRASAGSVDSLYVVQDNDMLTKKKLGEVGDSVEFEGLDKGDDLSVIVSEDGSEQILQTYSVAD